MKHAEKFSLFATTPKGMEEILEGELRSLGATNLEVARAGVRFEGSLELAYRVCLWSRIANRIFLPLSTFPASTPEKLYGGVKSIRWSDHLSAQSTIAVDCVGTHSDVSNTHFAALKTKDAICDQFMSIEGSRPSVNVKDPDVRIHVYLLEGEATVSIDLSGESLHRRGYREEGVEAPLKENLAAAILMSAGWPEAVRQGRETGQLPVLLDPMCGSGTLPIEAAWMAANRAPGILRERFGFMGWKQHQPALWAQVQNEAKNQEVTDRKLLPRIYGYDRDPRAVRTSIGNAELAGQAGRIHFEKRDLAQLENPIPGSVGLLVVNPPYGERLGDTEELKPVYEMLGTTMKHKFLGWDGFVFTSNPELAKSVGLKTSRRTIFFNGALECRLLKYELYRGTKKGSPLT